MSKTESSARSARAFARTERFAIACTDALGHEETLRIAFGQDAAVLLGNDVPAIARPQDTVRVWLGTKRCYVAIEGQLAAHHSEIDSFRWSGVHPEFELKWRLEPDVVMWGGSEPGPHAYLASEWLLGCPAGLAREPELVSFLDLHHPTLIEAVAWESGEPSAAGARLISIDPEGLLIQAAGRLRHVAFDAICPTANDVCEAIRRLVKNVSWTGTTRNMPRLRPRLSLLVSQGTEAETTSDRSERRTMGHGVGSATRPWLSPIRS